MDVLKNMFPNHLPMNAFFLFLPLEYGVILTAMLCLLSGVFAIMMGTRIIWMVQMDENIADEWTSALVLMKGVFHLALFSSLMMGVITEEQSLLIPWLFINTLELLHVFLFLVIPSKTSLYLLLDGMMLLYLWLIIYSYYLQLERPPVIVHHRSFWSF